MSDYQIGRGRPPKHTQFKPGVSPNPKGRPRTVPRAEVPSQIGRDVRKVGRLKTSITTPDGVMRVTFSEALIYRLWIDAIAGKVSQQKLLITLQRDALIDNIIRDDVLRNIDRLAINYPEIGSKDPTIRAWMTGLVARSKR